VLAADTGLGLAPWELKLFLKELDLGDDDRVSADRFCGIYTFLASRPPTPAAPPATAPSTEPVEAAAAAPAAPEPGVTTEPVVTTSAPAVPGDEAAKTREEPRTTDVQRTPIGVPFPPEFVLDPTGVVPVERADWSFCVTDEALSVESRWRRADGAGQCAAYPFLGAARAPQSRAVRSDASSSSSPRSLPAASALAALHTAPPESSSSPLVAFAAHPNEVSGVFHAFHQLLRFELGVDAAAADAGAGWWRCDKSAFLDLQSVYGASEDETNAARTGESIDVAFVMRRADLASRLAGDLGGSGSATAAQALLTLFAKNHNLLAARVAEKMKKDDESLAPSADSVFQVARHANCAAFRAVVLKDYLPFMRSGQHLAHVPEDPPGAETSAAEAPSSNEAPRGACVSVELDLLMRAVASVAPRETSTPSTNAPETSVAEALASASARRCGLGARRSLPARMAPSEAAAVRRARAAGACTLNAFRAAHGLARWADLDEMTAGEEALSRALADLYGGNVDDVELYTGFMCERNVADTGACLTATTRETAGRMLRALVSGDAFFSDAFLSGDDMSAAAEAAEFGKDATLAGLLEEHAGVTVAGASAFEVGALAMKEEEGNL
jgi:hypothetical protein